MLKLKDMNILKWIVAGVGFSIGAALTYMALRMIQILLNLLIGG